MLNLERLAAVLNDTCLKLMNANNAFKSSSVRLDANDHAIVLTGRDDEGRLTLFVRRTNNLPHRSCLLTVKDCICASDNGREYIISIHDDGAFAITTDGPTESTISDQLPGHIVTIANMIENMLFSKAVLACENKNVDITLPQSNQRVARLTDVNPNLRQYVGKTKDGSKLIFTLKHVNGKYYADLINPIVLSASFSDDGVNDAMAANAAVGMLCEQIRRQIKQLQDIQTKLLCNCTVPPEDYVAPIDM